VDQISPPLLWYALALWPAFGAFLLNRTLSAARRQRFILLTTAATVALTIVLDLVLLGPMEQAGLALASTIGVYASVLMSLAGMRNEFPALSVGALGRRQGRILLAGAVCGGTALALNLVAPTDDLEPLALVAALALKVLIALAAYAAAARILSRTELSEGIRSIRALVARDGAGR
jgi:peptidoglycan biosynthesis protein MviN/MurJ (putative lipid II flippase)